MLEVRSMMMTIQLCCLWRCRRSTFWLSVIIAYYLLHITCL